ncbi:MAG: helix-turn-helix transcriptional regulator [Thermoplasmata archaeon]|nr:helix-turn-helix transcriptional regulator [Thermoplasmata archaeon]
MKKGVRQKFEEHGPHEGEEKGHEGSNAFKDFLTLMSRKHTLDILHVIIIDDGASRFNKILKETGASPKTITSRLKELCSAGILDRTAYAEIPPRVEYSLTEKGQDIAPIMGSIGEWCRKWG